MANVGKIQELKEYVGILQQSNLDPENHLTDEQKELLMSADYLERLNAATAYFPSPETEAIAQSAMMAQEGDDEDDGEGEEEDEEDAVEEAEMDEEEDD